MRWDRAITVATAWLLAGPAVSAAQPPGAFELLAKVRSAYAAIDSYQDLGEIERTTTHDGTARTTLEFFETAADADGRFLWRTHGETAGGFEERVVWSDGQAAYVYTSLLRQYKPVSSIVAELAHGFGEASYEALIVPLLLAGADDALYGPDAASVEGSADCDDAQCWVLTLSRMGGSIESRLWIDPESYLIREVAVELEDPSQVRMAASGATSAAGAGGQRSTIRVRHHPAHGNEVTFEVPAGARQVAEWESGPPPDDAAEDPLLDLGLREEITVSLFTLVARIVDSHGDPIRGLEPGDLEIQIGDHDFPVRSLDWSSSHQLPAAPPPQELAEARVTARTGELSMAAEAGAAAGRKVLLFLQIDREATRIRGQLKILPDIEDLLRALPAEDRVGIVSFDSHLKLWQDFTRDRTATFDTLVKVVAGGGSPLARGGRASSLAESFDFRAAREAANPETALRLTAEAMGQLSGVKDLIYLGWGLGRFGPGGVRMTADYGPAVRALNAAETTVFVLDVTQADLHSLEVGLQSVAAHTGGTYSRTFHFSTQAVRRLAQTIGGHYVITIDRSSRPQAKGRLRIRLKEHKGRVHFKPTILG